MSKYVQIWVIRRHLPAYNDTWKGGKVCFLCRLPRLTSYLGAADRRLYDRCRGEHEGEFRISQQA